MLFASDWLALKVLSPLNTTFSKLVPSSFIIWVDVIATGVGTLLIICLALRIPSGISVFIG